MRSRGRKLLEDFVLNVESINSKLTARRNAKKRLKRMDGGFDIGDDYKNIVLPYWERYGIKPKKYWYQIFSDREKKVDPRYIRDDLYYGVIVPYYSNTQFRRFAEDKNQHDLIFKDLKRPGTLVKNVGSVFYDKDMNIIDQEKALDICMNFQGEYLIKPAIDSGEGRLIEFFDSRKTNRLILKEAMDNLKANYIIQESVIQDQRLAILNPSSLNTVRIVSFLFKGQVHILSSILRMGASDSKVDNIGAGGFACPIKEDGSLEEKGVNRKAEWVDQNQHEIKFADVTVPKYREIIEIIKREHSKLGHYKLVGWDFSVDQKGDPVFIEYNIVPGSNQISFGPTFGDLTEQVLEDVFVDKKLKYAKN